MRSIVVRSYNSPWPTWAPAGWSQSLWPIAAKGATSRMRSSTLAAGRNRSRYAMLPRVSCIGSVVTMTPTWLECVVLAEIGRPALHEHDHLLATAPHAGQHAVVDRKRPVGLVSGAADRLRAHFVRRRKMEHALFPRQHQRHRDSHLGHHQCATAAAAASSMRRPVRKRSMVKGALIGCGSSLAMVWAKTWPEPGVALKPPVPQPQLT